MSVAISIENVIKRFGKDATINGLSLGVRPSEFFTLLGPSGYGETALLHIVIGSNSIKGGEVKIDDKAINNIPANKRNTDMVSQNYAIFPHMSVRDSVAFSLKNRKVLQDQIESQVDGILRAVKVDHLKGRMPSKLSGDQQQRMALARAIVIHPEVLLMDEPLSNLDVGLRVKMRDIIKRIQQQVGITTIYVAHDQEEALAMSDRIAVMNGGVMQQTDTPKDVYRRPSNIFVSTFIRLSDIMGGRIGAKNGQTFLHVEGYSVPMESLSRSTDDNQTVKVSIRPEEFIINRESSDGIPAVVRSSILPGITAHYFVETVDGRGVEVIQNSGI